MKETLFKSGTLIFVLIIILICSAKLNGQSEEVGRIISGQEADSLFGEVLYSDTISTDKLVSLLADTEKFVMFQLIKGKVYILGDNRNPLFPNNYIPGENILFHLFSKTKVGELILSGSSLLTIIEKRRRVLSVTNGDKTLEYSYPCPPFCSP
ncbi:MAG: hypothetical protein GX452_02855 [Ignavibacteriales bacterium]|nr:hypothetical protein [Ignavibacteriaceae bacterium]NLH60327.1 hypothetical protein [Ignavibacteriales bacterium]HOJ18114.1 hypothetical protein [Ignavibacteriaceae bacterium]HPO56677.1 hypothetical protein [Ignavibacteriaceae bacterium]